MYHHNNISNIGSWFPTNSQKHTYCHSTVKHLFVLVFHLFKATFQHLFKCVQNEVVVDD